MANGEHDREHHWRSRLLPSATSEQKQRDKQKGTYAPTICPERHERTEAARQTEGNLSSTLTENVDGEEVEIGIDHYVAQPMTGIGIQLPR